MDQEPKRDADGFISLDFCAGLFTQPSQETIAAKRDEKSNPKRNDEKSKPGEHIQGEKLKSVEIKPNVSRELKSVEVKPKVSRESSRSKSKSRGGSKDGSSKVSKDVSKLSKDVSSKGDAARELRRDKRRSNEASTSALESSKLKLDAVPVFGQSSFGALDFGSLSALQSQPGFGFSQIAFGAFGVEKTFGVSESNKSNKENTKPKEESSRGAAGGTEISKPKPKRRSRSRSVKKSDVKNVPEKNLDGKDITMKEGEKEADLKPGRRSRAKAKPKAKSRSRQQKKSVQEDAQSCSDGEPSNAKPKQRARKKKVAEEQVSSDRNGESRQGSSDSEDFSSASSYEGSDDGDDPNAPKKPRGILRVKNLITPARVGPILKQPSPLRPCDFNS